MTSILQLSITWNILVKSFVLHWPHPNRNTNTTENTSLRSRTINFSSSSMNRRVREDLLFLRPSRRKSLGSVSNEIVCFICWIGGPFISFGTLAASHTICQNSAVASSPSKKKRRNGKSASKKSFTGHEEYNILREHLVSTEASVSGAPLITTPQNWLTLSSSKPCCSRIQSYEILKFNGVHIGALSHLEPATDAVVTLGQRKGIVFQQCRLNYYIPTDSVPFAFVFLTALQNLADRDNSRSVSSYYESHHDFDAVLGFVNTLEHMPTSPRSQSIEVSTAICDMIKSIRAQMHWMIDLRVVKRSEKQTSFLFSFCLF